MADIFISYSKNDRSITAKLVEELSQLWTVWWDDEIVGNYDEEIEREIDNAGMVVAVLSVSSEKNQNVRSELRRADRIEKKIFFAVLKNVEAPYQFEAKPKIDLEGWNGEYDSEKLRELKRKISQVIAPRSAPKRPKPTVGNCLKFPALFLSTSSFETKLEPNEAFEVLNLFKSDDVGTEVTRSNPTVLVSAYDLHEDNCDTEDDCKELNVLKDSINLLRKNGGFVLIDSGNYEAARLSDKSWSREKYGHALSDINYDWVLSFDYDDADEAGDRNPITAKQKILAGLVEDQKYTDRPVIPILHAPEKSDGGHDLSKLPEIAKDIAESASPPMIAIPERELGPGLFESAKTVKKIREALNQLPYYQPLHILGTGDPWSIAVYTAAGADSFDGLEWCRMVIDRDSGQWLHNQHFCLLSHQKGKVISDVASYALKADSGVEYGGRIAFHNLDFLSEFACNLREYTMKNEPRAFVEGWLPKETRSNLETEIPDLYIPPRLN